MSSDTNVDVDNEIKQESIPEQETISQNDNNFHVESTALEEKQQEEQQPSENSEQINENNNTFDDHQRSDTYDKTSTNDENEPQVEDNQDETTSSGVKRDRDELESSNNNNNVDDEEDPTIALAKRHEGATGVASTSVAPRQAAIGYDNGSLVSNFQAGGKNLLDTSRKSGNSDHIVCSKFLLTQAEAGSVIGKQGSHITSIQRQIGIRLKVSTMKETYPRDDRRMGFFEGPLEAVELGLLKVVDIIFGYPVEPGADTGKKDRPETGLLTLIVPTNLCPAIIGKQGAHIKQLQQKLGGKIEVNHRDEEIPEIRERKVTISGTYEQTKGLVSSVFRVMENNIPYCEFFVHGVKYDFDYSNAGNSRNLGNNNNNNNNRGRSRDRQPQQQQQQQYGNNVRGMQQQQQQQSHARTTGHSANQGATSLEIEFPVPLKLAVRDELVGSIVGRKGEAVALLERQTNTRIKVSQRGDLINNLHRVIQIFGAPENQLRAKALIYDIISNHKDSRGGVAPSPNMQNGIPQQYNPMQQPQPQNYHGGLPSHQSLPYGQQPHNMIPPTQQQHHHQQQQPTSYNNQPPSQHYPIPSTIMPIPSSNSANYQQQPGMYDSQPQTLYHPNSRGMNIHQGQQPSQYPPASQHNPRSAYYNPQEHQQQSSMPYGSGMIPSSSNNNPGGYYGTNSSVPPQPSNNYSMNSAVGGGGGGHIPNNNYGIPHTQNNYGNMGQQYQQLPPPPSAVNFTKPDDTYDPEHAGYDPNEAYDPSRPSVESVQVRPSPLYQPQKSGSSYGAYSR